MQAVAHGYVRRSDTIKDSFLKAAEGGVYRRAMMAVSLKTGQQTSGERKPQIV